MIKKKMFYGRCSLIRSLTTQVRKMMATCFVASLSESRKDRPTRINLSARNQQKSLRIQKVDAGGRPRQSTNLVSRPGVLTNGPRTGRCKILTEPSQWRNGIISRADVAQFLVRQIDDQAYLRKAPVLVK